MTSYKCSNCKHHSSFFSPFYKRVIPVCELTETSNGCVKEYEPINKEENENGIQLQNGKSS